MLIIPKKFYKKTNLELNFHNIYPGALIQLLSKFHAMASSLQNLFNNFHKNSKQTFRKWKPILNDKAVFI